MVGYALSTCQAASFYVARLCLFQIPGYSVSLKQEDTNKGMWVCSFKNRRKYGYRLLVIARLKTVSRIEIKNGKRWKDECVTSNEHSHSSLTVLIYFSGFYWFFSRLYLFLPDFISFFSNRSAICHSPDLFILSESCDSEKAIISRLLLPVLSALSSY